MKTKLFTLALLLAASLSGFAQDKASLKAATKKMIDLTDHENYSDLTGTVYPKVFNLISKDDYLNQLEKTMKGPDYTIHMVRIDPSIDYGAIKSYGNGVFCMVNYNQMMTIEFEQKIAEKDRKAKEDYFKKLFNTEEVYFIDTNNTIDVKRRIEIVAIADESSSSQWTFLDPKHPIAKEIFEEEVRNELNNPEVNSEAEAEKGKGTSSVEAEVAKNKAEKEAILKSQKN